MVCLCLPKQRFELTRLRSTTVLLLHCRSRVVLGRCCGLLEDCSRLSRSSENHVLHWLNSRRLHRIEAPAHLRLLPSCIAEDWSSLLHPVTLLLLCLSRSEHWCCLLSLEHRPRLLLALPKDRCGSLLLELLLLRIELTPVSLRHHKRWWWCLLSLLPEHWSSCWERIVWALGLLLLVLRLEHWALTWVIEAWLLLWHEWLGRLLAESWLWCRLTERVERLLLLAKRREGCLLRICTIVSQAKAWHSTTSITEPRLLVICVALLVALRVRCSTTLWIVHGSLLLFLSFCPPSIILVIQGHVSFACKLSFLPLCSDRTEWRLKLVSVLLGVVVHSTFRAILDRGFIFVIGARLLLDSTKNVGQSEHFIGRLFVDICASEVCKATKRFITGCIIGWLWIEDQRVAVVLVNRRQRWVQFTSSVVVDQVKWFFVGRLLISIVGLTSILLAHIAALIVHLRRACSGLLRLKNVSLIGSSILWLLLRLLARWAIAIHGGGATKWIWRHWRLKWPRVVPGHIWT